MSSNGISYQQLRDYLNDARSGAKDIAEPVGNLEDKWKLLPAFLKARGLFRQHIDSFNHFVQKEIKEIMLANQEWRCKSESRFYWRYTDIRIGQPEVVTGVKLVEKLTPQECRLRNVTYAAPITVDIKYWKNGHCRAEGINIGYLPIMLRSSSCILSGKSDTQLAGLNECPYDPGGYFICKGQEKVVLIQEHLSKNRIIVDKDKNKQIFATVTSETHQRKTRTDVITKTDTKTGDLQIYLKHNSFVEEIPICLIFKGMGVASDQEIMQLIGCRNSALMVPSLAMSAKLRIFTEKQALEYLGVRSKRWGTFRSSKTKAEMAREVLDVILGHVASRTPRVPGMISGYNFQAKSVYLGVMIRRILTSIKANKGGAAKGTLDDKDYYGNKRLELAGQAISLMFEGLFKGFNKDLRRIADKTLSHRNVASAYDLVLSMGQLNRITHGLEVALRTGNWKIKEFRVDRKGVTENLSRLSYIACLGMITRIQSNVDPTSKVTGPRALQPSQWGMICPSDTPEGASCGLIKNLALLAHVTSDDEVLQIVRWAFNLGVQDIELMSGGELDYADLFLVMLNGQILGAHQNPSEFARKFRTLRRRGQIPTFVSVYENKDHKTVYLASDGGRVCRPLIIVKDLQVQVKASHLTDLNKGLRTFDDFLSEGLLEYLDCNEENNCFIALDEACIDATTTHLEIDPMTILGVVAGLIPYPHHNQSPRNTYQCAMGKQAVGAIGYNQLNRFDTKLMLNVYPQKPMVKTRTLDLIGFDKLPAGQNATVAVMSYSGYDIEDAVVLNQASIDRGFMRISYMTKYYTPIKSGYSNSMKDRIFKPPATFKFAKQEQDYAALDKEDGLSSVGQIVQPGQILVNKAVPKDTTSPEVFGSVGPSQYRDEPLRYKGPGRGVVDKVMVTSNKEEAMLIKVLMRDTRVPELGDKFSSRHGQKGVCGIIVPQEDLPFNDQGICPDLIMNPHGFPSRMTVGKMIELLAGKAGLFEGRQGYGTAFGGDKVLDVCADLVKNGYSYSGKDMLTSGITGEYLEAYVFMGPIYYQRLKHMVKDKMFARHGRGPVHPLTRQPVEGRSRGGGLRLGEMERDCLVAYGVSGVMLERMVTSSDSYHVPVCKTCGLMGYNNWCQYCKKKQKMPVIRLPYAAKLLVQELLAMNIMTRLRVETY